MLGKWGVLPELFAFDEYLLDGVLELLAVGRLVLVVRLDDFLEADLA